MLYCRLMIWSMRRWRIWISNFDDDFYMGLILGWLMSGLMVRGARLEGLYRWDFWWWCLYVVWRFLNWSVMIVTLWWVESFWEIILVCMLDFLRKNSNLWTLVEYVGIFSIVNLIANFAFCLFYNVKLFIIIDDKIH